MWNIVLTRVFSLISWTHIVVTCNLFLLRHKAVGLIVVMLDYNSNFSGTGKFSNSSHANLDVAETEEGQ